MNDRIEYLPIFVVSLPGESVRKDLIRQQLDGYPGHWEFFDAVVPGATSSMAWDSELDSKKSIRVLGRPMTRGEFGCAHSHRRVMQRIIDDKRKAAIILEDDAIISGDIHLICMEALSKLSFDTLLLGYSKVPASELWMRHLSEPIHTIFSVFGRQLGFAYRERRSGTVGYLVTEGGARKLLGIQNEFVTVADDWPFFKNQGLNILHLFPTVVLEDTFSTSSSIADDRRIVEGDWKKGFVALRSVARIVRGFVWAIVLNFRSAEVAKRYFGINKTLLD